VEAINDNTRIVVLLNPNNPVGNAYTKEEVEKVIDKARIVGAIVLIDEAYYYYYDQTFIDYALEKDNVIVLRTFSKLMSLAACRLGIIISNEKLIHYVKNARLTFDVNSIALLFAERLIEKPELIDKMIKDATEGKAYLLDELKKNNYWTKDCLGNFIFIKTKKNAKEVAKELEDKYKLLVHPYGNELLKDYIRVSTGSKASMKIFLDKFLEVDR
jgi:histidinol-phosphate aminotransferase